MREFRGKTYKGDWIEGNFIDWGNHVQVYIFPLLDFATSYDLGISIRMYAQAVIPETVGQYTGLTDKNGRKIFEGDIVNIYWKNNIICCGDIRYNEQDCRFVIFEDYIFPYGFDKTNDFEVIGNIYDNPELLES